MESNTILQWLEEMYPDKLPFNEIGAYDLGILVGQRKLIEQLKVKLNIQPIIEEEIK